MTPPASPSNVEPSPCRPWTSPTASRPLPVPAGTYELSLDNYGAAPHTLTSDELGVDLEASEGRSATTTVDFPPGRHTFYCTLSGHRDAGREFTLHIE